jgi:hypothetical protein
MRRLPAALSAICFVLGACDRPAAAPRPVESSGTIDSIFTVEEDIRRFQATHSTRATGSISGPSSRDQLVAGFIAALEARDTAKLNRLALSAHEFIELYYPSSPYTRPPYRQSPEFVWFQFQQNGNKGLTRALTRYGGSVAGYRGYTCASAPVQQGEARLWRDCIIQWRLQPHSIRIFGTIIQLADRFKFVSYGNDL